MQRSSLIPSTSTAYLFLMTALLFGLPLLTAYYNVDSSFYVTALIPYLVGTVSIAVLLIVLSLRKNNGLGSFPSSSSLPAPYDGKPVKSSFIGKFNSIPLYVTLGLFTLMVALLGWMRQLIDSYYPYPPPRFTDYVGGGYILSLTVVSILAISRSVD
ncbi:MAG: hypothetical protein M1587_05800, partial [Thaumarchaeota archaeon]|nr:hypothetical protein [Nitrososphaerota archaeon]